LNRHDYLVRASAGGYPEALARETGRRRRAWFGNYIERIVQRDAADVSALQRLSDLPGLLRLLAARNATELNQLSLAGDAGIPARTLPPYLDLLEALYLIERIPVWSPNLTKRVVSRPKVILLDSGLAAALINVSADGASVGANPDLAGQLLEAFAISELRRQLSWADEAPRLYHYREHSGSEIDVVLETPDGRVAALEVKASATVQSRDVRWLAHFRDRLGSRFMGGLILFTGQNAVGLGDRLAAVPLDALWSRRPIESSDRR
jgi:predicted AAA+ superfamily ATPase